MDKKDQIRAEDLLEKLQKHVPTSEILEEKPLEPTENHIADAESRPVTLEELFGRTFIDRKSSRNAPKSIVKSELKKPRLIEEKEETTDQTKAKIDETDYNLRTIFGMDSDMSLKDDADEPNESANQPTVMPVKEHDIYDDITPKEIKKLTKTYQWGMLTRVLRLIGLVPLSLVVLFLELSAVIGVSLPAFFNPVSHPVTVGWLAIQVMVFTALLISGSFDAFKKRRKHRINRSAPELICYVLLIVHTVYLLVRIACFSNDTMKTFCFPVMMSAICCELYHFFEWKREYRTFRVAFSPEYKYTLLEANEQSAKSEREALRDCMPEETRFFMVERIKNVESFHRLFHAEGPVKRPIKLILPAAALIAIGLGITVFALTPSIESAVTALMGTFAMTMPISLLYIFYAPMASLSKTAYKYNSAVVGEGAMEEYTSPAAVVFTDADLFAPENIRLVGVKVYDGADLSKALGYASAIFCETGGALGEMFASIVESTGYTADMDFITVEDDGLRAAVNGELVMVGNLEFMKREGFTVPFDSHDFDSENSIMYLAIGRELSAKMEIAYELDREFESVAKNIFKSGMCVAIRTFDPNISKAMLEEYIRWGGDMPLKIVRGKDRNDRIAIKKSAAGWIVSADRRGLFETIKLCSTTRHLMQTGVILAGLSMLVSIPVLGLILKFAGVEQINAITVAIYQAVWLLPSISVTKLFG